MRRLFGVPASTTTGVIVIMRFGFLILQGCGDDNGVGPGPDTQGRWQALGQGMNQTVEALAVYDGELIAAGTFTEAGGAQAIRIARWDDSAWRPLGDGLLSWTRALVVWDGRLIAGAPDPHYPAGFSVTAWDGASWSPLGNPLGQRVECLEVWNGELYAGTTDAAVQNKCLFRYAGDDWTPLENPFDLHVSALEVWDGKLVVAGAGSRGPDSIAVAVVAWDGAVWDTLGCWLEPSVTIPEDPTTFVSDMAVYDGDLIVAGSLPSEDLTRSMVKRLLGSQWQSLGVATNMYDFAHTLCVRNGQLYMGGVCGMTGDDQSQNVVACWNGASWSALGALNNAVRALLVWNGHLVAGGHFTTAGTQTVNRIARWVDAR